MSTSPGIGLGRLEGGGGRAGGGRGVAYYRNGSIIGLLKVLWIVNKDFGKLIFICVDIKNY